MSTRSDIMDIICEDQKQRSIYSRHYLQSMRVRDSGHAVFAFLGFDKQMTFDKFARYYYEMAYAEEFAKIDSDNHEEVVKWLDAFKATPIDMLSEKELLRYLTAWNEDGKPHTFHK